MYKLWATVLAFLGVASFSENNGKKALTDEQKDRLTNTFGDTIIQKLNSSFDSNSDPDFDPVVVASTITDLETRLATALQEKATLALDKTALESEKAANLATIADQKQAIHILSATAESDPLPVKTTQITEPKWEVRNDQFLGGVNAPFMAIDDKHPYNKRAYSAIMLTRFGISVPVAEASSFDYESLKTDLGDFYKVRKQERIQSFLQKLPSLEGIFPLESGYQDRAVLVNLFLLDEFSQADNTSSDFDNVVKGSYKFEPEELRMFDVMFAHKFKDLKKLEKTWIGYLNREGSDTMKWSFIEYIMVETGKKLHNEREQRRINGIRVNPTLNTPGTALGAADGFRQFIKTKLAEFKIRPFALGEWTENTIAEYIRKGTSMVPSIIRDSGNCVLYFSPDALTAYHKNLETLYGVNQDYKANIQYVKEYPNVEIVTVPNLGESKRMIWTIRGNFAMFEDKPGEMYRFFFEQTDWTLKVWSNWKESFWAYYVGKKYSSLADIPSDYSTQMIFCNDVDYPQDFYVPMAANDTTPSVAHHTSIVSVANTAATAITDIDDAVVGKEIRIKCGNATNGITIAQAGNFSLLTAAWNPAVDDVLVLKKRSDGKFIELDRQTKTSSMTMFAANDTTPSVAAGSDFVTNANTGATAITTLDDAITGRVYTLYGAGAANASTIANAGNFKLTAAMTLNAGKWIQLQKSVADGLFYEINRG